MKHTPGPWKVHKHEHVNNEQWLSVLQGAWDITHNGAKNPNVIADAKYSAMTDSENLANAKLIAAAPDLLEACQDAIYTIDALFEDLYDTNNVDDECIYNTNETISKLKSAIRKATE